MRGVMNPARRNLRFAVGDRAWLSTANLPIRTGARKLAATWTGPFRVTEVVAKEAYRLGLPKQWLVHDVFHTSQLKEVAGCLPQGEAEIVLEDGEKEFEVEALLGDRVVRGT